MTMHQDGSADGGVAVIECPTTDVKKKPDLKKPRMWKVIVLNDDYTPMDFVVAILMNYFRKSEVEAQRLMLEVHNKGKAIAGVYTFDVAESKIDVVGLACRQVGHSLRLTMEAE